MTSMFTRIAGLFLLGLASAGAATDLDEVDRRLQAGDHGQALQLLEQSADANGVRARFLRSAALAGAGRSDEAIAVLEALIAEHPELPEPYNNLAALYAARGDFEKAKTVLEQALRTSESYATIYENLSTVYVEMARRSYARALHVVKDSDAPRLGLLYALDGYAPAPAAAEPTSPEPVVAPAAVVPEAPPAEAAPGPEPSVVAAAEARAPEPQVGVPAGDAAEAGPPTVPPGGDATDAPGATAEAAEPPLAIAAEPADEDIEPAKRAQERINSRKQAVMAALKRWAGAWSDQDVDRYLAAYSAEFEPEDGLSRERWAKSRRQRITRPDWIKVTLDDLEIRAEADRMVVELMQGYRSNTYADRSRKRFVLVERGGEWKIGAEQTLQVFR